jgi:hypothetical protein
MSPDGILNACRLLRRPRLALALLRARPGYFLEVLAGGIDVHVH